MSERSRTKYVMQQLGLEGYQRTLQVVRSLEHQPHELAALKSITLKEATLQLMRRKIEEKDVQ